MSISPLDALVNARISGARPSAMSASERLAESLNEPGALSQSRAAQPRRSPSSSWLNRALEEEPEPSEREPAEVPRSKMISTC